MYKKLPMYLFFFYIAHRPDDFDAGKFITQDIGVFWAQMTLAAFARCPFRAKKS
jgi:hypothetical protein